MSSEFEIYLEKYVEVILKVGINLQKGQRLLITPHAGFNASLIDIAPFIKLIAKKAYQLGARFVEVLWNDLQLHLIRLQHAPHDSFEEFPIWRRDAYLEFIQNADAGLSIMASDPNIFSDQDPELMTTIINTRLKHLKPVSVLLNQKKATNWSVFTVPIDGWAKKVFPDLPSDKQLAKLWDEIFNICRIKQKDPVSAWNNHINHLIARTNYLNEKQYTSLKLRAPSTDLKIGLPEGHIWKGGKSTSQKEIDVVGNIPTEEVYTLPHKDMTEGTVKMTKPLNYRGFLIEDIKISFSKGKIVDITASKGKKFLDKIVKTDGGASQLGEIALVPHSSPISQSNILFYNGLIDENASCHIALGFAYRPSLKKGKDMSDEEFMNAGGNVSLIHIDFMIGSGEMDIDGITKEGTAEPIMRKGEWAFEV